MPSNVSVWCILMSALCQKLGGHESVETAFLSQKCRIQSVATQISILHPYKIQTKFKPVQTEFKPIQGDSNHFAPLFFSKYFTHGPLSSATPAVRGWMQKCARLAIEMRLLRPFRAWHRRRTLPRAPLIPRFSLGWLISDLRPSSTRLASRG